MVDKQVHKDALRNCEKACIPAEKLRDYCLNQNHPEGGSKARVFKSVLGFESQHWEQLADIISMSLPYYPAFKGKSDAFGQRWTVYIPVSGFKGNLAVVTTGWIVKPEQPHTPSLTTCFIETKKQEQLKDQLGPELEK